MAEVVITMTARSKVFRLLSEHQIEQALLNLQREWPDSGLLWRKGADSNEYHFRKPSEDRVIVFVDEGEKFVVVTQMHDHPEYHDRDIFVQIDREEWKRVFAGRA